MRLLVYSLLVCSVLCADGTGAHDIPLKSSIGTEPENGYGTPGILQRMEERLIQMAARLETLTHTVDTQLAQLDNSVLQLYREVGSSRLTETLAELRQAALAAKAPAATAAASPPDLADTISQEIRQSEQQLQRHQHSGVYTIFPPVCGNGGGIRVFCDMETDGGGWTVLMRRADVADHQDFNMGWQSYKWGFGNLSSEFWLGNEYMSLLTSMDQMQLRVDLKAWDNASTFSTYTPFSIGTEQQKYAIKIGVIGRLTTCQRP
ncbi:ryncolin-1-like [Pollicipes pollicipes]|uniref:ryncolin-1-like n=1 Tax=Pollicipes pollicipes TaxID=41117 RepID=UPI001885282F|nr:ryncolin-1-like [Pollicipes pollicipes]XP_037092189.1 ryncolin-1-like [Pollicipes pollicipes]